MRCTACGYRGEPVGRVFMCPDCGYSMPMPSTFQPVDIGGLRGVAPRPLTPPTAEELAGNTPDDDEPEPPKPTKKKKLTFGRTVAKCDCCLNTFSRSSSSRTASCNTCRDRIPQSLRLKGRVASFSLRHYSQRHVNQQTRLRARRAA